MCEVSRLTHAFTHVQTQAKSTAGTGQCRMGGPRRLRSYACAKPYYSSNSLRYVNMDMDAWLKYLRPKNLMVRINIQYQFGIDVVCSSSIIELLERRKFHG